MSLDSKSRPTEIEYTPDIDHVRPNTSLANPDPFKFSHGFSGVDQPSDYLFVHVLLVTTLVTVSIAFVIRVARSIQSKRRLKVAISPGQSLHNSKRSSPVRWGYPETYLLFAWSLASQHVRPQVLISTVYMLSNITYCIASMPLLTWPWPQDVAHLRGRCGTLAAFNLVLAILFAVRNNPLIWILHISFDTFNYFHRWIARLVVCQVAVHVLAFAYNTWNVTYNGRDGWDSIVWVLHHSLSFRMGLSAFAAFILLAFHSLGPLRRSFYDTFVAMHRMGAIIAITGLYFHLATHALPQLPWIYLIIGFLIVEILARGFRIVYYNASWRRRIWSQVTVEALPGQATRVTFSIPRSWNANPGSHIHVYLPRIALWSSHPFSVAWTHTSGYTLLDSEKLPSNIADLKIDSGPGTMSCIIRARAGMTRKLRSFAQRSDSDTVSLWGAIEGPYGGFHSLDSYGTVVLFAAGVGITHQLSFVRHLLAGHNNGTNATQKILLVWCIPHIEALEWIEPWLEDVAAMDKFEEVVRIRLQVSRMSHIELDTRDIPSCLDVRRQICDVEEVVDEEILTHVGAMVVTACGPSGFNNTVKKAVSRRTFSGSIDFIEEAFTY
ncbi:ferric reductase [Setomelanomma holmii]|uniref:Ferric reductase n=1 Tax=Setomelanomma holmii TaxID=210430 RepID=A0A9P4LSY6_9PLEO|nr:ferric reductase [Setomelanomma holmii]